MPKDPLGILKPRNNSDNSDPLGILKKKEAKAPEQQSPQVAPVQEQVIPLQKRFSDIFSADSILDRDLASTHAETLTSANNIPAPAFSLTGFNQQQAANNSLTPSFEDARKAKINEVKNNPDALRDYRKKRVKEIDDNINSLKNKAQANVDPATTVMAGLAAPTVDLSNSIQISDNVKEQEDYRDELTKSIADAAAVAVPKSFYSAGKKPSMEEVGKKYLETVGYGAIKDDERVLSQLKDAKLNDEDTQTAELTSQTIRNRFVKEGAAALSAYHVSQAEDIQNNFPDKIKRYTDLLNLVKSKPEDQSAKASLDALTASDPEIKSFADNTSLALRFADEGATSSKYFPQVKREEKRQALNDIFFNIESKKAEERAGSLNPLNHVRNAFSALMGEDPSEANIKQISKESGIAEDEVRSIINDGKEGFFGKARKGVRVSGALTGISQAADETLASSLAGIRRLLNVSDVDSKNALLKTKTDAYNMSASQNTLYDKQGNLNLNPMSIANTAGRGIGQMAVFAAPTLVTGGFTAGLLAPELRAAALAGKDASVASGIVKGSEVLTTHAAGYLGSYESAYKDIAAYTDDEDTRRGYANVVAHANAGAEHLMSPADIAKSVGVGKASKEAIIKAFIKDGQKFGVEETVGKRLSQAGLKMLEIGGAENIEEQATNLVTNTADAAYMNKSRSASELADQFWQTLNTTTINMLPMMVGAGMSGYNDISGIRKEGLFEVGNEPEVIKAKLKSLLDSDGINQDTFNSRTSIVNTMEGIVSKVNNLTKKDGTPLTYDEKVSIAAQQYRIAHNNNIKSNGAIDAQAGQVQKDNEEAISEQKAILEDSPLYKVNGNVVDKKEAKDAIEKKSDTDIIEIKNDEELSSLLKSKNEAPSTLAEVSKEPTIQDVLEKPVTYNGMTGTIVRDGMQYVFQQDDSNREYVVEPSEDYESKPVSDLGIHPIDQVAPVEDKSGKNADAIQAKISIGETLTPEEEKYKKLYELSGKKFEPQKVSPVVLNDDNTVSVRGENYVNNYSDPFQAINRDENGYVVSVNLDTADGGKRTFRGDVANDIAYQMHLKEITKDNATRAEFEDFINTDEQSAAEIRSNDQQGDSAGATDNTGGASETAKSSPNSDNGAVQATEGTKTGTEPATAAGDAATVIAADTGTTTNGQSGQQQPTSGRTDSSVSNTSGKVYDSTDNFKEAFDRLSPEDKVKYGELLANDQHDEADALLNQVNLNSLESKSSDVNYSDSGSVTASLSSEADLNQLSKKVNSEPYKQSIIKRAKIIYDVVKKFVPNIEIFIHSDADAMQASVAELGLNTSTSEALYTWGTVDGVDINRIDINLSAAKLGVVAHEATHAVLHALFGDNKAAFAGFKDRIAKVLDQSDNNDLINFSNRYRNEDVRAEEYLAELGSILQVREDALKKIEVKPSILLKIKNIINSVVNKALGRNLLVSENDKISDVRDFFASMNRAFRTGELNSEEIRAKAAKAGATVGAKVIAETPNQKPIYERNKISDNAEDNKIPVNKTGATQNFFSDVVTGKSDKFKPKKEWKPILPILKSEEKFAEIYNKFKGNFDMHIATSIPTFRELQVKVGNAITNTLGQPLKIINEELVKLKDEYINKFKVKTNQVGLKGLDVSFFKKVADLHDNSKDDRKSEAVIKTYRAFMNETRAMYDTLVEAGYKIEPYLGDGEPYGVDSNAVRKDIRDNKHLYYLQSRSATGQGEENLSGDDYILFESTGIEINGQDVLYNDLFRAVHDIFSHGMLSNNTFSSQGEFNAYLTHSNMYSPEAQKALFIETVAYNAWYNFGEHRRREDGSIPNKSDSDFDASKISYAPRKLYNVPDSFIEEARRSPLVYDIGGSEGGFVKSITEASNGSIKTVNLDVNADMQQAHNRNNVGGSKFVNEAFFEDYTDENGDTIKRHVPSEKADIVHESMVFQFISPERQGFINEVADNYLREDGVLMLEEKVTPDSETEWAENEKKKDAYKLQYYPQEALTQKAEQVLAGMKANQTQESDLIKALSKKFGFIRQYWDSGNFKGYIASNSKEKVDNLVKAIGNTKSEFSRGKLVNLNSRESILTPLSFEQRKRRLDTARNAGALSEDQYQRALDKAMSSTGTKIEDALSPEEKASYDNYFNKNARPISLNERIANITIPDTDLASPYSANKTFAKAGFDSKGRPAQGNTTTIPLMVQANIDFINQLISEGSDAINNLMNYFGINENYGKLARDFNMEGIKTLNDYRLANVLFAYINQAPLSELNISPEQVKRYSQYLKKFSSELGREIGQSLNTAKIRKVAGAVLNDMILESTLSASEYNAISEAEDAIVDILSGDAKMSDEELAAAEDLYFETELEKEKQAKQSTLLGKLLNLKSKEEKLGGEVSESKSKKVIERINKQLNKTKEDIKDIINKIKCD